MEVVLSLLGVTDSTNKITYGINTRVVLSLAGITLSTGYLRISPHTSKAHWQLSDEDTTALGAKT